MQTSDPTETGDDFGLWILYSLLWSIAGFVFWLASVFWAFPIAGDALVMLTIGVVFFGLLLRLPTLTHLIDSSSTPDGKGIVDEQQASQDFLSGFINANAARFLTRDDIVFAILTIGALNWTGGLLLHSASLLGGFIVLFLATLGEVWLWYRLYVSGHLSELATILPEPVKGYFQRPTAWLSSPSEKAVSKNVDADPIVDSEDQDETDSAIQRRMEDGFDEEGRRFLSGEVKIQLAEKQMSEEIVIGFQPAFSGVPDTDFELVSDDIRCRLVNVTPTGMRLAIRRTGSDSTEEVSSTIEWFALQISPAGSENTVKELP